MNSKKDMIYCATFVHLFILHLSQSCMSTEKANSPKPPEEIKCEGIIPCIPLHQCESANELLRLRNYQDRIKVQQSQCGFKDEIMKVCCAEKAPVEGLEDEDIFPRKCGIISNSVRIIGGTETEMGEFPWLVAMFYTHRTKPNYHNLHCAGSLINPRYVMTAAHCLHRGSIRNLVLDGIRIGDHNLTSSKDCMRNPDGSMDCNMAYIEAKAEDVIIHPRYELENNFNDIALIRLDTTVDMDEKRGNIAPACLPSAGINPEFLARMSKRNATVVGWGHTGNGSSDVPLKVSIPFYTDKQSCAKKQRQPLIKEQVCLGGAEGKDSCQGDSGGPLMLVGDRLAPYLQIGIVSYGHADCGLKHLPAVYTSVSHYIDWIRSCVKPW